MYIVRKVLFILIPAFDVKFLNNYMRSKILYQKSFYIVYSLIQFLTFFTNFFSDEILLHCFSFSYYYKR